MNQLLGISIPTYKRPDQLLTTVHSIAKAGGLEHDIPIFIADDSADETNSEVFKQLRKDYPLLTIHKNPTNLGIDGNILHSVNVNNCDYVWILGEDDRLVSGSISKVLKILRENTYSFIYVNYASVNANFSKTLKPKSLLLKADNTTTSEEFWRTSAWSAGFIGACIVRKEEWNRIDSSRYIGTWFAHVGTIMELCHAKRIMQIAESLVLNRCGTTEVFTWTDSMLDVLDGWRRLALLLEPIYGKEACDASLNSFRRAHGLGTVKFLAYARAGGALTPRVVREQIATGPEKLFYKLSAYLIARLPIRWFRVMQNWRHSL